MLKRYNLLIIIPVFIFLSFEKIHAEWEIVGSWPYGSCNTVIADSNYVYIGSGGVITIVDMTIPSVPVEMSSIVTPGTVCDLFVTADYLYVANKWGGLCIIDIIDPFNPMLIGKYETPLLAWSICVTNDYAYLGCDGCLYILDISNPVNPVQVEYFGSIDAADIFIYGGFAYVADTGPGAPGGLRIFDIRDPSNPLKVGSNDFGDAFHVVVFEHYAYVTASHEGLYIFDVSDPSNPIEVGHLYAGAWVWDVQVSDNYAYVATNNDGLCIIDIKDPLNPVELNSYIYPEPPGWQASDWESLCVFGDYAYITFTYGGLRTVNVKEPSNPILVNSFATSGSAFDVYVSGHYAYIANDDFHIMDISDPTNPVEIGGIYTQETDASSVFVSNDFAYVSGHTGLRIFDVKEPSNPVEVSSVMSTWGDIRYQSTFVSGNYVYFLSFGQGLRIIDISDPLNPVVVGNFYNSDDIETRAIYVSGDYAYITYGNDHEDQFRGLRILNISVPSKPEEKGSFSTPTNANGLFVLDGYAYIAENDCFRILDVSNPSNPIEVSSYPGFYLDVFVSDGFAYVTSPYEGLNIINVSDPLNPLRVGLISKMEPWGVYVSGSYVYITDLDFGLYILNNSVPGTNKVSIPDTVFLNALIKQGVDTNEDSLISYAEAKAITSLNLAGSLGSELSPRIFNITGIHAFINLDTLILDRNGITNLDFSFNTALRHLSVTGNQLTFLNISNCPYLLYLSVQGSAHFSLCPYLNQLTSLDVSNNTALTELNCSENQITSLDISNNTGIEVLSIRNMPFLNEVCVWTHSFPHEGVTVYKEGSPNVYFTTVCGAPEIVATDTLYQPELIEVTSTEDGMIYLVPMNTDKDFTLIQGVCIDSVVALANSTVNLSVVSLGNGVYWLYARDEGYNISEPKAFTIMGVGIDNTLADQFRIYPNPTIESITIETNAHGQNTIEITSLNGQLIFSGEMEGISQQFDISSYQKGVYFITVRSRDYVRNEKFIKL